MNDREPGDEHWIIPNGAPIRVSEWLAPPIAYLVVVVLAFVALWGAVESGSLAARALAACAALLLATCVVLTVFGYRAYRDLTERSVIQFRISAVASSLLAGALLSFGPIPFGAFLLAVAGFQLAKVDLQIVGHVGLAMTDAFWKRIVIATAVSTVVGLLARPLTSALGFPLLTAIDILLIGLCPLIAGFAYRTRKVYSKLVRRKLSATLADGGRPA